MVRKRVSRSNYWRIIERYMVLCNNQPHYSAAAVRVSGCTPEKPSISMIASAVTPIEVAEKGGGTRARPPL